MRDLMLTLFVGLSFILIALLMFNGLLKAKEIDKKCNQTALESGFPDYDILNGKCYGKSLSKSELLYKIQE